MLGWLKGGRAFFLSPDKLLVEQVLSNQCSSVALFGAGDLGIAVYFKLKKQGIIVEGWYDSKVTTTASRFMDAYLLPPNKLSEQQPEWLIIASEAFAGEIKHSCLELGFKGRFLTL